jgi:SecD/SecF fusion protein
MNKKKLTTNELEEKDQSSEIDDLLADVASTDSISAPSENLILDKIVGQGFQGGPVLAQFATRDGEEILGYLNRSDVRRLLPAEYRYVSFVLGKPDVDTDVIELFALRSNRDNRAPLSGGVVVDAIQTFDQVGNPAVSMQMDSRGARIWENMTGKAFKESSNIAIVLDDIVYSAPGVSLVLFLVDVLKLQEIFL